MIRAFKLEWLKLKHYRVFWMLFGIYLLAQLTITNGGVLVLEWLKNEGAEFNGIDPTILPIYDFPDIWQNTTWLGSFIKLLIGFIVIVSVNNDLTYNTMRQNIIDGVSKKEFILSKFTLILFIAGICTLTLFTSGLITGFIYSHVTDINYILDELEFVAAYFLQLVVFSMFAFSVAIVIKKAGFAIVFLALYCLFLEPTATTIMEFAPPLKPYTADFVKFFPLYSINNLNNHFEAPFQRYLFKEITDNIAWYKWLLAIAWMSIFLAFVSYRLNKKDLKV